MTIEAPTVINGDAPTYGTPVNIEIWIPVISVIVSALAANIVTIYLRRQDKKDVRSSIQIDLDILSRATVGSDLASKIEQHVAARYAQLADWETHAKQDPAGISAAIFLLIVAGALIYPVWRFETWYWWFLAAPGVVVGLVGFYGFFTSIVKKPRLGRNSE